MATNGKLTPAQQRAIASLLVERDTRAAAVAARVGPRTLYRWMHDDETFKRALQVAEGRLLDEHMRRLCGLMGKALNTLDRLMDSADRDSVKESAANHIAQRLLNWRQLVNLEQRITTLEEQLNAQSAR